MKTLKSVEKCNDKFSKTQVVIYMFWMFVGLLLSGCSVWKEDFDTKPVRGLPTASIHEISTMVDNGTIKEDDIRGNVRTIKTSPRNFENSGNLFSDGNVSRGSERIHRIYVAAYEDENSNLHEAHNLYVVVEPATWTFHKKDGVLKK